LNAKAEAEFLAEMEDLRAGRIKGKEDAAGLAEPGWTHDADVRARARGERLPGEVRGVRGRSAHNLRHRSKGSLRKAGLADQSFEGFRQGSLIAPRQKRAINENAARFAETQALEIPGARKRPERVITESELDDAIARGDIDPERHAWLDAQGWKSAVLDPETPKSDVRVFMESVDAAAARRYAEAAGGRKASQGRKYIVVERTALDEFLKQHRGVSEGLLKGALKSQRIASTALLGYSPAWLLAQPIAEAAQALVAVGPINMARGLNAYRKLSDEEKRAFDANLGGTAGVGAVHDVAIQMGDLGGARTKVGQALERSRPGRVVRGVTTGKYFNNFDRRKGLAIRRAAGAGHVVREYKSFRSGLRNLLREQEGLARRLKGKSLDDQLAYFANNPKAAAKLEGYVDDVMGNWTALTHKERVASAFVIFYPFVRMSLEWTLLTFPARHPLKASILHFLAQQNAEQVENLLGGKPSFFTQWATVPLYAGEDGAPTSLLPLARIAPGSNALIEAVGDLDGPRDLLRLANPAISALAAATGQYDPLSGKNIGEEYEEPSYGAFFRSLASTAGYLPAPLRALDIATGRKASRALKGKDETPTSQLFDKLNEDALIRSLVPFIPQRTAKEREKQDIGRLLDRAYAASDGDLGEAFANAAHDLAQGKGEKAQEDFVKVLDALVASNRLQRLYRQKGIDAPSFKSQVKEMAKRNGITVDQAEALVFGQLPDFQRHKPWNEILETAQTAGLPVKRLKKLRRARARSLMAYDDSIADYKRRRARLAGS
jgi:hypothetical protein